MDKLQYIPIAKIKVRDRSRENLGDIQGLAESIKDKGLIVPLIVNSKMELRAGGRRITAAKVAGLTSVPCLIREDADTLDGLEIELIENVFRKDFTWDEYSKHIKKLHDHCAAKNIDWSGRKTALLLGEPSKNVQRALSLANALEEMPELAKLRTQDEAEKVVKRLHEEVITTELRRRQDVQTKDKGLKITLDIAKANYRIGDCFKGMAELKTNGMVHFIELDPPYGIDLNDTKKGADHKAQRYNEIPTKDYEQFMTRMAKETYRVAHHHAWMICWFGPTHFTLVKSALVKAGWSVNDIPGIWVKESGQTMAPEYNLANCYEPFFICRKGQPTLVKRGRSNVFNFPAVPPSQKYHTTQRPMALIEELIQTFCVPTQVCLVPCLGSGTTIRACYMTGLGVFGWDISTDYLDKFLLAVEEDTRKINKQE